jgi:hypothetical protein
VQAHKTTGVHVEQETTLSVCDVPLIQIARQGDELVIELPRATQVRCGVPIEGISYHSTEGAQVRIPFPQAPTLTCLGLGGPVASMTAAAYHGKEEQDAADRQVRQDSAERRVNRLLEDLGSLELTQDAAARVIAVLRQRVRL